MQVFKAFFKIAKNKLSSIIIYFAVFSVLTFLLSNSADSTNNSLQEIATSSLKISVIDQDTSASSQALTNYLGQFHTLIPSDADEESIQDNLYYRTIQYVLIIPEDFEESLCNGTSDSLLENVKVPGSYNGFYVDEQLSEYLNTVRLYLADGFSLTDALSKTNTVLSKKIPVNRISFADTVNTEGTAMYYFFQYLPYIFIVLLLNGLTPILITFNKKDLNARISCSALSLSQRNFQLTLCSILYCLLTWLVFMLFAFLIYGSQFLSRNGVLCMLNSFVFLLIASAFTLFASCFPLTSNLLNMLSNVVGLGISFLGGIFVPQWLLSDSVLSFSRFLPTYWYVKSNNMIGSLSSELYSTNSYQTYLGIQIAFSIALFALAMVASKYTRQKKN